MNTRKIPAYQPEETMIRRNMFGILLLGCFLLITICGMELITNRSYVLYLNTSNPSGAAYTYSSISVSQDDIVEITDISSTEKGLRVSFLPLQRGETDILIDRQQIHLIVNPLLVIYDMTNGNYSGYFYVMIFIMIFLLLVTMLLGIGFFRARKRYHYSYQTMYYGGIGLWFFHTTVIQIIAAFYVFHNPAVYTLHTFYAVLLDSGLLFMQFSFPFVLLFAGFMLISNLQLMRKESRRPQNALGMMIGFVMIAGEVLIGLFSTIPLSGSEFFVHLLSGMFHMLCAVFVLLECLLLGAILCGILAARHEPDHHQDYILILGCAIRKDGSLYPLIRGRVDRAIHFYQDQLRETGIAPILIPSGGKGSDECISEAEAMARYLREQGIPEEHILREDQSGNTLQNMQFSRKLIEEREGQLEPGKNDPSDPDNTAANEILREMPIRVAFSTTQYHIFRAGILSHSAGFDPDGMGSPTKWYFWPNAFMREVAGLLSYRKKTIGILLAGFAIFFFLAEFFLQ